MVLYYIRFFLFYDTISYDPPSSFDLLPSLLFWNNMFILLFIFILYDMFFFCIGLCVYTSARSLYFLMLLVPFLIYVNILWIIPFVFGHMLSIVQSIKNKQYIHANIVLKFRPSFHLTCVIARTSKLQKPPQALRRSVWNFGIAFMKTDRMVRMLRAFPGSRDAHAGRVRRARWGCRRHRQPHAG